MKTYEETIKQVANMYDHELMHRKDNLTNEEVSQAITEALSIAYGVKYATVKKDLMEAVCLG